MYGGERVSSTFMQVLKIEFRSPFSCAYSRSSSPLSYHVALLPHWIQRNLHTQILLSSRFNYNSIAVTKSPSISTDYTLNHLLSHITKPMIMCFLCFILFRHVSQINQETLKGRDKPLLSRWLLPQSPIYNTTTNVPIKF